MHKVHYRSKHNIFQQIEFDNYFCTDNKYTNTETFPNKLFIDKKNIIDRILFYSLI